MTPAAILFDFDGVLIESEVHSNRAIADALAASGFPIEPAEAQARFMGLSGAGYAAALRDFTGLDDMPASFHERHDAAYARMRAEGVDPVAGAIAFVRALPPGLARAIVSSSGTRWIRAHLAHLGLQDAFGEHVYSGREHVANGKPAPDLYRFAAAQLGVDIAATLVIEDSPVGVTGALASGAHVVGLCAGTHCAAGHADVLRRKGVEWVAAGFDEIAARLDFPVPMAMRAG